jgi:S1-C subfamily serine protease
MKRKNASNPYLQITIGLLIIIGFLVFAIFTRNQSASNKFTNNTNLNTQTTTSQQQYVCPDGSVVSDASLCPPTITPQQQCENKGNIWCDNQCYNQCPTGQSFNCPSYGNPTCIVTHSIEDMEKSVVFIIYSGVVTTNYGDTAIPQYGSGVIYSQVGNNFYVITSRHVVDCWFSGSCRYANVPKRSENIAIITKGGTFYNPIKVMFAPHNLDLATLEFQTTDSDITLALLNSENYSIGDKVTAIGYPAVVNYPTVLEFSITDGTITNYRDLLTGDGFSFNAIETNAITNAGSSGGGLFNKYGQLIGIVTWKDYASQNALAIDIKTIQSINYQFIACPNGYFVGSDEKCYPYCPVGYVIGDDSRCHQTCGNPITYCKTGSCYYGMCI